jgi:hypothetical protein
MEEQQYVPAGYFSPPSDEHLQGVLLLIWSRP